MKPFRCFMEEMMVNHSSLLFEVSNSLSGSHGRGGSIERSAGNCLKNPQWEFHFKQWPKQVEKMLIGQQVYIEDMSFSSYHECYLRLKAYILISTSEELIYKFESLIPYATFDHSRITYNFPFVGYKDSVKNGTKSKLGQIELPREFGNKKAELRSNSSLPGETSEEYWKRLMAKAKYEIDKTTPKQYGGD